MKTVKTRTGHITQEEMQKKFRFVTVAFFIISLFISLINLQSISILPSWLNISSIILLICSIALFGYGLSLSKKYISWVKGGVHFFFFLLVISFQLLLTSNGMYTIGVREGQIVEGENFSQLTLLLYLASAIILLVLSLFISSPKLRSMDGYKAYVMGTILAVVIIAIIFIALNVIRGTFFSNPDTVKESYEFFMSSVLALLPATVLGVSIIRAKKQGIE
ncbi:hypothetical protein M3172_20735 [Mesobacillus subterraneus]|uniref:hypothetical protein n=1 Tax=Mesobacillus subterraneus TaxID=285983 RepID=UPI00203E7D33|nr:hypothetical protein [Mesobacillus subterraneus]MCM3575623.1 hypothetical protein [Mesobacillus subterraneus]